MCLLFDVNLSPWACLDSLPAAISISSTNSLNPAASADGILSNNSKTAIAFISPHIDVINYIDTFPDGDFLMPTLVLVL